MSYTKCLNKGKVIIFSAPSGSGKTTLVRYCLEQIPQLAFSVSCTTRIPRGEEKDGIDYYFLSPEAFKEKIENDDFAEYEEVYPNLFYGTLNAEVERIWSEAKVVVFDVDVQGGIQLKNKFQEKALSILIIPPSINELEQRLLLRNTDTLETIKMRVAKAKEELSFAEKFDIQLINDNLNQAKHELLMHLNPFLNY